MANWKKISLGHLALGIIAYAEVGIAAEDATSSKPARASSEQQPSETRAARAGDEPTQRSDNGGHVDEVEDTNAAGAPETSDKDKHEGTRQRELSKEDRAVSAFEEGRTLIGEEQYEAACAKFEESLALVEGVGTKFNLADCYDKLGKKGKAHALFLEVAAVTAQAGQKLRYEAARSRARALEPELGLLRLRVDDPSDELEILMGSDVALHHDLSAESFVDPGKYRLRARAPGKKDWQKTVFVEAGQTVTVRVPTLAKVEQIEDVEDQSETAEPDPEAADFGDDEAEEENGLSWVPPVLVGVGAVGLFVGLAYTQQYRSSHQDAKNVCPTSFGCTREEIERHQDLVDDSRRARWYAAAGYGVATLGLVGGAAYYFVYSGADNRETTGVSLSLSPTLAVHSAGGVVHGRF